MFDHIPTYTDLTVLLLDSLNLLLQSRRRRRDAIGHEAEQCWQHLQLYLHGCQVFAEDEGTSTALQRHLVRTTAASLLDWLLHYQVILDHVCLH